MKKLTRLIQNRTEKQERKETEYDFQHFSPVAKDNGTGGRKKTRPQNDYTQWPLNINRNKKSESEEAIPLPELQTLRKNKNTGCTIASYCDALYSQMQLQIQYPNGSFTMDSPAYTQIKKIAGKLGFQKCETDYYKWETFTRLLLTGKAEWYSTVLELLTDAFQKICMYIETNVLRRAYVVEFWTSIEHTTEIVFNDVIVKKSKEIMSQQPDATLHSSLIFMGKIWNYFDKKRANRELLDDELDSIAETHMRVLLEKLETVIAVTSKKIFWERVCNPTVEQLNSGISILIQELETNKDYWKHLLPKYMINLNLYNIIYSVWDYEMSETMKPLISATKDSIIPIKFEDNYPILSQNVDTNGAIQIFSLFRTLKKFSSFAYETGLPNILHVKRNLYTWFQDFVPHWLDVTCYKAIVRIDKAVKIDEFEPMHLTSKKSISAVDTVQTFQSIQHFWNELDWPVPEDACAFAILTLQNFNRCIHFYVESIYNRVEELEADHFHQYEISDELCQALNNVEYVTLELESIVRNLGTEKLLEKFPNFQKICGLKNGVCVEDCDYSAISQYLATTPNIIENWTDNIHRRTSYSLVLSCNKQIEPLIHMYIETAVSDRDSHKLIRHLNGILERLTSKLTTSEYKRLLPTISERILDSFLAFANKNLSLKNSTEFYVQLESMLCNLCSLFLNKNIEELDPEVYSHIHILHKNIQLHKSSTLELVLSYLQYRYMESSRNSEHHEGLLTLLADYEPSTEKLRIKILNASYKNVGDVNSFVKFKIYSSDYENSRSYCTKVMKKNQYPLFEEMFELKLKNDGFSSGGYIQFWFKVGYTSWWSFGGEGCLPLKNVHVRVGNETLESVDQIKIPLTKPKTNMPVLDIIKNRRDSLGTKFVTQQTRRIPKV